MSSTIYDLRGLRILTKKEVCALVPYTPQERRASCTGV
jgi:hypothetical protein